MTQNIDILFVGHTTKDEITIDEETSKIPGGGVYFGSMSAAYCKKAFNINANLEVLTIGNPEDFQQVESESALASISLHIIPDQKTSTFCHSFIDNNPDKRVTTIPSVARSFTVEDIQQYHSKFTYVNPLFFGEIPLDVFRNLKERCELISIDAQGLLRNRDGDKAILKVPAELIEFLKLVDILKVDTAEAIALTGKSDWEEGCRDLIKMGPKLIICTRTDEVSVMDSNFKIYTSSFGEWSLKGRTGRGDTISAAFILLHYINGKPIQEALDIAAKATGKKMMHPGAAIASDYEF